MAARRQSAEMMPRWKTVVSLIKVSVSRNPSPVLLLRRAALRSGRPHAEQRVPPTKTRADRNWLQLQVGSTREHLILEREKRQRFAQDLATTKVLLERSAAVLDDEQQRHRATWDDRDRTLAALRETQHALSETAQRLRSAHDRLAVFDEIGPTLLRVALRFSRMAGPFRRFLSADEVLDKALPQWSLERSVSGQGGH